MRISEAIDRYASYQEARGDTRTHRAESRRILHCLYRIIGDLELERIEVNFLQQFLTEVRSRPGRGGGKQVSELTVFAYYRTLCAFFNHLETADLLSPNPMRHLPKPRVGEYLIRPFSEEQVKKLLEQPKRTTFTGLRDFTMMLLILDTGCRISECLSLTLDRLDLHNRLVRVLGNGRTSYVFVNQYGEHLTRYTAAHRIAAYGKQACLSGVRVSPHTFRHTFGVNWLLGQGDFKGDTLSLQRILVHSSPKTTERYMHLASEDLRKLHDRLSPVDWLDAPTPKDRRKRIR